MIVLLYLHAFVSSIIIRAIYNIILIFHANFGEKFAHDIKKSKASALLWQELLKQFLVMSRCITAFSYSIKRPVIRSAIESRSPLKPMFCVQDLIWTQFLLIFYRKLFEFLVSTLFKFLNLSFLCLLRLRCSSNFDCLLAPLNAALLYRNFSFQCKFRKLLAVLERTCRIDLIVLPRVTFLALAPLNAFLPSLLIL